MQTIQLLYFAGVRTAIAGEPASQQISLPDEPTPFPLSRLRDYLVTAIHPDNEELAHVLQRSAWSVSEEMIDDENEGDVVLRGGETVCPIPPVSGG